MNYGILVLYFLFQIVSAVPKSKCEITKYSLKLCKCIYLQNVFMCWIKLLHDAHLKEYTVYLRIFQSVICLVVFSSIKILNCQYLHCCENIHLNVSETPSAISVRVHSLCGNQ